MFCETQDSFSPLWMDLLNSYISYINLAFIYTIYMFFADVTTSGFLNSTGNFYNYFY